MRSKPSASPSRSSASRRAVLLPRRRKSSVAQLSTRLIDQGSGCGSLTLGLEKKRGCGARSLGFGRHAARRWDAGDFEAALGGGFLGRVWVPRRPVKRERIRGPLEFGFGEAAAGRGQHRAARLPFPAPPGPIPKAIPPEAALARAMREPDFFA